MSNDLKTKVQQLKGSNTLNPHPERVTDVLFQKHDFFDSRDLLQVKYEMIRRVQFDGWTVSRAADAFGFSRPSFYHALEAFQEHGLSGLMPNKRGPRQAHKLSPEVLDFVRQQRVVEPTMSSTAITLLIEKQFGISVHPRSIERALVRRKKKHRKDING